MASVGGARSNRGKWNDRGSENSGSEPKSPESEIQRPSEETRREIIIRDEFPFLNYQDCPLELKILVADMISAYHRYKQEFKKLFVPMPNISMGEMASNVVEAYLENRLIWRELIYYKINKKVLGEHAIFHIMDNIKSIRKMNIPELIRKEKALSNAISRTKKLIRDNKQSHLRLEREKRIENKMKEWIEVRKILNL